MAKILVIDDEESTRKGLETFLTANGHGVLRTSNRLKRTGTNWGKCFSIFSEIPRTPCPRGDV